MKLKLAFTQIHELEWEITF